MLKEFIFIVLSFSSTAQAIDLANKTYAQAAQEIVPTAFAELIPLLQKIDKHVKPDQVKVPVDIRKQILRVRDFVDLFAYALPDNKKNFEKLRDDLDEGYELMGAFKDLFDIQSVDAAEAEYDKEDVKKRREPLLKWIKHFLDVAPEHKKYLQKMDKVSIYIKNKEVLSPFYWGVSKSIPQEDQSAQLVFQQLVHDILGHCQRDLPEVRKIINPAESLDEVEVVHDFRKRVRTVVKIVTYFPSTVDWTDEERELLQELARQYGRVSDQIAALELAIEKKQKSQVKKLKKETQLLWEEIQDWEANLDLPTKLMRFQESLKRYSQQ